MSRNRPCRKYHMLYAPSFNVSRFYAMFLEDWNEDMYDCAGVHWEMDIGTRDMRRRTLSIYHAGGIFPADLSDMACFRHMDEARYLCKCRANMPDFLWLVIASILELRFL